MQTTLKEAAVKRRRTGTSLIPVFLDELITHALRFKDEDIKPFIQALFEIHDEIDLAIDAARGMMASANTSLRYHWLIRRLTLDRLDLDQRTSLYSEAIRDAPIGWLADFASTVVRQHDKSEDERPAPEENLLVNQTAVAGIRQLALEKIRSEAASGTLLNHKDLIYILYRWRDFADDTSTEVVDWTSGLLNRSDAIVVLARRLTGESWSQGMGMFGLGDRVAQRHTQAELDERSDILNVTALIQNLRTLQASGSLNSDDQLAVDTFLAAWQRKVGGDED